LYEKKGLALFKTHYYGGIKKYQWTALPLALHGVVILGSGEKIPVILGEDRRDPVFTVTDLLPHLAQEQGKRKLAEGVKGEELNVLVGSIPLQGEYKKKVKLAVLKYQNDTFGMVEEDFSAADFEVVPAIPARDVGLDRGMVGAYGQDDRVCAYASYKAIEQLQVPEKTALALFMDKEEVGSMGNTGMQSRVLEDILYDLSEGLECTVPAIKVFNASEALSADVSPAIDPTWDSVMDDPNSARMGGGICITKYTGSRGKAAASEAHAEFAAKVRRIFNQNGVIWQTGELGKVDAGGGGTIAQFLANLNMDVIDCGVPVLSMHSPFEITSKADIFMGCRAYKVFLESS
jgi:aspartyl aminopeptidase